MTRPVSTQMQKPKTPLYGRKAREARRRDNARWSSGKWSWEIKRNFNENTRAKLHARGDWIAQDEGTEPEVAFENRDLKLDKLAPYSTESGNYKVDLHVMHDGQYFSLREVDSMQRLTTRGGSFYERNHSRGRDRHVRLVA